MPTDWDEAPASQAKADLEPTQKSSIADDLGASLNKGKTYGTGKDDPPLMRPVRNSEEALNATGGFGAYQVMLIVALQLTIIQFAGNVAFMSFATYLPDVKCYSKHKGTEPLLFFAKNSSSASNLDFCDSYENDDCKKVKYHAAFGTIIAEWDLICDYNYVPEMINSIQQFGALTTVFGIGILSDQFGRKTVFMSCYVLLILTDILAASTPNLILFTICRCCIGALYHACASVAFVWCMEVVVARRSVVMNVMNHWFIGYIMVGIVGYLTRQWRLYLWSLNVLGAPMIVFFALAIVESPRWLVQKGQLGKAANALRWIARINNSTSASSLTKKTLEGIERDPTEKKLTIGDSLLMLKEPSLRTYLLVVSFLMFTATAINHTYIFHVSLLQGDPTVKFILYGLARCPVVLAAYLLDLKFKWFGRRLMTVLPLAIILAFYSANMLNRILQPQFASGWPIDLVSMLLSAVMCSMLWTGIYAYMIELFPTVIRNTAFAVIIVAESLAGILVPQLVYIEEFHWPDVLVILCLSLSLLSIVVTLAVLPETKGQLLPEHLEKVDDIGKPVAPVTGSASSSSAEGKAESTAK